MAKKSKPKKVKHLTAIPKDVRPYVVKKYRTKDRTKRFLAVRLPNDDGYDVRVLAKGKVAPVRDFKVPVRQSDVPTPVWLSALRQLASWYAGHMARRGQPPSIRQERGRRKKYLKKSLAAFHAHMATKGVVGVLKNVPGAKRLPAPTVQLPYICFYNPNARKSESVFHVHTAYCFNLDHVRRRIHKRGGTSWVIEAKTPDEAVALQVAEFDEDDKGYDKSDFKIHKCQGDKGDSKT